jgi:hypothetical protein
MDAKKKERKSLRRKRSASSHSSFQRPRRRLAPTSFFNPGICSSLLNPPREVNWAQKKPSTTTTK